MSNPYIVGYTSDNIKVITLFSSLSFDYDDDNKYIEYFGTQSGDNLYRLESVDGLSINISDLKCKTYEEVLMEMDVYNLLHGNEISDEICTMGTKIDTDNALKKKVKELAKENKQLKLKLKQLKILIDK